MDERIGEVDGWVGGSYQGDLEGGGPEVVEDDVGGLFVHVVHSKEEGGGGVLVNQTQHLF